MMLLGLSQMTDYINEFDKNKNKNTITISLLDKDKQLLKNYNKIWTKIEKLMNIDFDSKPIYGNDDKYIRTKIKTYEGNIIANFYDKNGSKKIPEEKIPCKYLSIIILNSVLYAYEKYHQIFLEECKYKHKQERIKTKNYIDKELKSESDTDNDTDTDINKDN